MSAREPDDLTDDDVEVVDAHPVTLDEEQRLEAPRPAPHASLAREVSPSPARVVPVTQAAVVAATSFAAGVAAAAVVRGVTKRHAVKSASRRGPRHGLPVVGSRSFLVDVHLLGPKD